MDLGFIRFEELRVFQLAEELGDLVWETVIYWDYFSALKSIIKYKED